MSDLSRPRLSEGWVPECRITWPLRWFWDIHSQELMLLLSFFDMGIIITVYKLNHLAGRHSIFMASPPLPLSCFYLFLIIRL